jgi:hypothetical protein
MSKILEDIQYIREYGDLPQHEYSKEDVNRFQSTPGVMSWGSAYYALYKGVYVGFMSIGDNYALAWFIIEDEKDISITQPLPFE